jgi:hypothetical protein
VEFVYEFCNVVKDSPPETLDLTGRRKRVEIMEWLTDEQESEREND